MADAVARLAALEPERPLILDGLVFGSLDPAGLARVRAPVVAMIHHPLALESGLTDDRRAHLHRTERDNLGSRAMSSCRARTRSDPRPTTACPAAGSPSRGPEPTAPPALLPRPRRR